MTEYDATYRRAKGHHFLQHDLPRLSQKAVLTLIGATSITEALHWLHSKKPADLRVGLLQIKRPGRGHGPAGVALAAKFSHIFPFITCRRCLK